MKHRGQDGIVPPFDEGTRRFRIPFFAMIRLGRNAEFHRGYERTRGAIGGRTVVYAVVFFEREEDGIDGFGEGIEGYAEEDRENVD